MPPRTTTTRYDGTTSTVAPLKPARERLLSLDVFRGITIAAMLLVNDPGSWGAIFPPLEHAEWNGWTPADLIFPFYQWGTIDGISDPSVLDRIVVRLQHVRILGVLPRIAIAYVCGALLTFHTTLKQQVAIIATLLFGYWFAMTLIPVPRNIILKV